MRWLVIGAPGSGKTTQAKILAQKHGLCLVKIGSMLRDYVEREHHPEVLSLMESGQLVGDNLAAELVKDQMEGEECKLGFVSDGYPRSLDQLEVYDPKIDRVIYVKVSEAELSRRLKERGRLDDDAQTVNQRIEVFDTLTMPMIEHYAKLGKVVEVDGQGSVDQVAKRIEGALKE